MPELADIFRSAGPAYRAARGDRLLPSQRRAMADIVACRTAALGGSLYACDECDALVYRYHSCRNRHCPRCQQDRAQDWLTRVRARLLPCDHYLLTVTLPQELRPLAHSHQQQVYDSLLREAAAAVQAIAQDPAWVGGTVGILAVLHTWSRTLTYHPHAHLLVSAGALAADDAAWLKPAHARFFAPGYALSQVFRARLRAALTRAGLAAGLDAALWNRKWVVHVQQIGRGEHAALYLSRYVYRVALSNDRIERFADGKVTFRYTHARTHETRRTTLQVEQFIDRFLLHTLPRGFARVRSYGLFSSSNGKKLERARHILEQHARAALPPCAPTNVTESTAPDTTPTTVIAGRRCPVCHSPHLHFVQRLRRARAPP